MDGLKLWFEPHARAGTAEDSAAAATYEFGAVHVHGVAAHGRLFGADDRSALPVAADTSMAVSVECNSAAHAVASVNKPAHISRKRKIGARSGVLFMVGSSS
jgi:hypothetical protein